MTTALLRGGPCSNAVVLDVGEDTGFLTVDVEFPQVVSVVMSSPGRNYIYKRTGRCELIEDPNDKNKTISAAVFQVDFRLMEENFQYEMTLKPP